MPGFSFTFVLNQTGMSSEKEKSAVEVYNKMINVALFKEPIENIAPHIDDRFMAYGTASDEKIFGLEGFQWLVHRQWQEMDPDNIVIKRTPVLHQFFGSNDSALVVEEIEMQMKEDDSTHSVPLRLSCLLEYSNEGWKIVHFHGSVADANTLPGSSWPIEEWKRRNLELEQQVAEQTADLQQKNRELEIEAATQRVRAAAMGMQAPEDIMDVLRIVKEEISKFKLENIATWIWTKDDEDLITQWDISELIEEGNLVNFNLRFDINKYPEVNRHKKEWEKGKKYYALNWNGVELQAVIDEVADVDPESGKMFQKAVDAGQIADYWHAASPFSKGVVGLDFVSPPPETAEPILTKMADAFDMAYRRFEDLQKAKAQARESKIETALERVRSRTMAMQKSDELNEVSILLYEELKSLGINKSFMNCGFMEVNEDNRIQKGWMTRPDGTEMEKFTLPLIGDPVLQKRYDAWKNQDSLFIQKVGGNELQKHIEFVNPQLGSKVVDEMVREEFPETAIFYCGNFDQGYLSLISGEPLTSEEKVIFTRFARVFQQTYTRFLDLQKAEKQAYESKVEASLERVRGMAAAMNHSDDLMQIAEAMFREMEILQINPLRYGLGMINGEKKEAELWASTVDDGRYLDMLGTISLTWHPMLNQVFDAWEGQLEEVLYELKGKERSDYYEKIGQINPEIPGLKELQNPETEIVQYVSFFPFKTGALYAFTKCEPSEEGKSILKRFANVFEQAHIRYEDLQTAEKQARLIREERDRLEIALKELEATKDQLVQQEKLASLGQLTAGIAHEIKNPLNFVNNFSELSLELVEEARDEIKEINSELKIENLELSEILNDIEANLKTIHKHGSRADGIVKSMLQHSRGGDGKMEPTPLNPLVKEYVNLAFHGMRAGKESDQCGY